MNERAAFVNNASTSLAPRRVESGVPYAPLPVRGWQRPHVALVGVGIGSVAAIGTTHLVSSLLYGFSGFDPIVFILACLLLVLLALIASYLPARRAATLDPVVALRQG